MGPRDPVRVGGPPAPAAGADVGTRSSFVRAADGGHAEVARALLRAGARFDVPDGQKKLPLSPAIMEGRIEIVKIFLEEGLDVNRFDASGATPLGRSVISGRPEIARLLLSRGADPRKLDAKHPAEAVFKDANLMKGLCKDAACRARFDEAIALVRKAGAR